MKDISIAMATYNEADNLKMSLPAVADWSREIVVVDGGSTDDTVAVAKQFGAKVTVTDNPPVFHINKQRALDKCSGDWIFQLDADEVISPELSAEIQSIANQRRRECDGYYVPRKNYFLGHWMRKGGQYPDYVIRLFKKGKGSFPAKSVHEQIAIDGKVGYISSPLLHYSYRTLAEYMMKANRYSRLEAKKLAAQKLPKNVFSYVTYNTLMPIATFFNLFVRHKGFFDGFYGFLYACLSGMQHAMAYQIYLRMKS